MGRSDEVAVGPHRGLSTPRSRVAKRETVIGPSPVLGDVAIGTRVDVHLHLTQYWRDLPGTAYRPDLDYTVRGLLDELDRAGIGPGLAIPVHQVPDVGAGLEEGRSLRAESGGRLRLVSTVDPGIGDEGVAAAVERWGRTPELTAIKLFPGYLPFYPHD